MITTLLELTGRIRAISSPRQAMKMLWCRDLLLGVEGGSQPGEGPVKIQFSGERLSLLDAVQVGERATVAFSIRGVEYEREGTVKHLIVLVGQHLWVHSDAPRKVVQAGISPAEAAEYDGADLDNVSDESGFQPQPIRLASRMNDLPGKQASAPARRKIASQPSKSPRKVKDSATKTADSPSSSFPKANASGEEPPF